jgi:aerobic-type carbon monoxide dehydrogenase small subunit (CoxS/CutS family)
MIKTTYYNQWKVGKDGMWVEVLLESYELDLQCSFCKMTMVINSELVLKEVSNKNSII